MICKGCAEAAALGKQGKEAHKEFGCKEGSHCTCQHRVGTVQELYNLTGKYIIPVG